MDRQGWNVKEREGEKMESKPFEFYEIGLYKNTLYIIYIIRYNNIILYSYSGR